MIWVVLICVLCLLALSVPGVLWGRGHVGRRLVYGGSVLLCLLLLYCGLASLGAPPATMTLPFGVPWIGVHIRLDPLAAAFLVLIGLGGCGASLFAIGYGRHEQTPERVLPFYPVFLAGMALVTIANDAFAFLFAWEVMSLASWGLVMADHRDADTARAGFVYLIMATFSGLALLLAFGLLAGPHGNYGFAAMRAVPETGLRATLIFLLALIGTGAKAGLVPLQVWLPMAHPAAPSHASALMSGVMTKIAVFGFIRIVFDLLGGVTWWHAVLVMGIGGVTAVYGVLQALMERDVKRILACSTIENIGIIFIGLGLAIAFHADGFTPGATLALTAALFHAFNHTLFKSLLFFVAGSVVNAVGSRDLQRFGGLIRRMRLTAVAALIGAMAISALPPLNGFASEWMIFQAILVRPELPQWGLKIMLPVDGAMLALAAALAAACFVRLFGVAFLGRPRSPPAAEAREVDAFSLTAMFGFGILCLLAGMVPGVAIDALAPVVHAMLGSRMPVQLNDPWLTIAPVSAGRGSYNGLLLFCFIAGSMILAVVVIHRLASRSLRRAAAWDCGFPDPSPVTQYSADSFAQPLRRIFGTLVFRTREIVDMPGPGETRAASIRKLAQDPVWDALYDPLGRLVLHTSSLMNVLQFLTIRRYLGFVFVALVVLLLALTLWQ
jgi:hydrogenase-4 component B